METQDKEGAMYEDRQEEAPARAEQEHASVARQLYEGGGECVLFLCKPVILMCGQLVFCSTGCACNVKCVSEASLLKPRLPQLPPPPPHPPPSLWSMISLPVLRNPCGCSCAQVAHAKDNGKRTDVCQNKVLSSLVRLDARPTDTCLSR